MSQSNLELYSLIASPDTRLQGSKMIAKLIGAEELMVFDFDDEIQKYLPSIGFPQIVAEGKKWGVFLDACAAQGTASDNLPVNDRNSRVEVTGKSFGRCIWVIVGGTKTTLPKLESFSLLASNLCTVLANERQATKYEGQNSTLKELTTDLRLYADALNRAKTELNDALRQAESAKLAAERANATKSAFLANMSHEIRTPLGAIIGYAGLMKEPNLSPDDRDQFVGTIVKNGQQLTQIIDDILDLAKVEAGHLAIEEINFEVFEILGEVVELFRQKAKQKGLYLLLNIDESVPERISSDPTRLRQILINLLGNAIKFTDSGGVRVAVKAMRDDEGPIRITVEVKDTGRGISPEQKANLFQPFVQADNTTTRQYGGTGLGLALSRRLAEAMGGTIYIADCEADVGCSFIFSFVAATPVKEDEVNSPTSAFNPDTHLLEGVRVLVIEDSPDNQFLIKRMLVKEGATVDLSDNGRQGVAHALAGSHDVILMDIQMPEMDGYEAVQTLINAGYSKPIIALTAHAMSEDRAKTKIAGFTGHITKPIDGKELMSLIRHAVKPTKN